MLDLPEPAPLGQLRDVLQQLAIAGAEQPSLFGDRSAKPAALAAEFDRCATVVLSGTGLDPVARDAMAALGEKLETMSRDGAEFDADLWTDAAVRTSEHWADVRRLAVAALQTL